ncbi:Uncharacterized protein FKW44_012114, partial [Caligus rogercresseyi]
QNILCNGRSIREVIDEASSESNTTLPYAPPTFNFIYPQKELLTLILDRSQTSHWDLLQKALFQFIARLPLGVYLSVITYGTKDASLNLPPTLITSANRAGLHGRIPRRALEDGGDAESSPLAPCLSCGIDMALKESSDMEELSPVWILATGGSTNTFLQRVPRMDEVKASNITVYAISTASDESYLQDLTTNHFIVAPELSELSSALNTVLKLSTQRSIIHFHKETLLLNNSRNADELLLGNFVVEDKLRKNLWIQVTALDERDIEYFEILSPTEKSIPSPHMSMPGIWSYGIKLYYYTETENETYPVHVEVLGEANEDDAVILDSWVTTDVSQEVPKVYVYARVTLGEHIPVLNADVQALIYPPNSEEGITLTLRDSGTGYPDITGSDGIYSAYFTGFADASGYYRMTVTAGHNGGKALTPKIISRLESEFMEAEESVPCCGSSKQVDFTVPMTPFKRLSLPPSFYVETPANFYARHGSSNDDDFFPPSRITDFALDSYEDSDSLFVHLKWTAPGGDYDTGMAFRYEIRCYTNKEALRDENFSEMSIPVHATLIPSPESYGTPQTCTVGVPWVNEVFYYAIVAYDESGNRGRISNTIAVFIKEEEATTVPIIAIEVDKEEIAFYSGSDPWDFKILPLHFPRKGLEDGSHTTTSSLSGTLKKIMALPDVTPEKGNLWTTESSCKRGIQARASNGDLSGNPRVHRVDETQSTKVTEYYDSSESVSENNNLLVSVPRISVMEDYSIYRDLSHLSSAKSHFSLGIPADLGGKQIPGNVFVTTVPNMLSEAPRKPRHESLV